MSAKPVTIRVSDGGHLMSGASADTAGIANWTIKRDFRRVLEREVQAEGYSLFAPNTSRPDQPPANGKAITLIAECKRENGQRALIVGTNTTLWRYCGLEDGGYDSGDYDAEQYDQELYGALDQSGDVIATNAWMQIGGDFHGDHWEAENIAGYLVLNNGVDLPVTYRVESVAVEPIHELREQGIASVGTIGEHNGMLHCANLLQIKEAELAGILAGATPYGAVTSPALTERFPARDVWSGLGSPRRFGAVIGCTVDTSKNVITLDYAAQSLEVGQEVTIVGAGSGGGNVTAKIIWISGTSVLLAESAITAAGGTGIIDTQLARADVGDNFIGGLFEDLTGDGSAIVRVKALHQFLVVYKETSNFLGRYTGRTADPYEFEELKFPRDRALRHSRTLADIGGRAHIYAGQFDIFRFDLTTLLPQEESVLTLCRDRFFSQTWEHVGALTPSSIIEESTFSQYTFTVTPGRRYTWSWGAVVVEFIAETVEVILETYKAPGEDPVPGVLTEIVYAAPFAAVNTLTSEVFFCSPQSASDDKALRFDYKYNTASTTSGDYTAAASVEIPDVLPPGEFKEVFLMGTADGKVLQYGLTRTGAAIYTRNGQAYNCVLQSGSGDFASPETDKQLVQYTLIVSSQTADTPVGLVLRTGVSPGALADDLSTTIEKPRTEPMVPVMAMGYYLGDRITVNGSNPIEVVGRTFTVAGIRSAAFSKRETS